MARQDGIALKAYPRLSFLITIKGVDAVNYRIETKESFEVFGIERVFQSDESGDTPSTPAQFWQQSHANGEVEHLVKPLRRCIDDFMRNGSRRQAMSMWMKWKCKFAAKEAAFTLLNCGSPLGKSNACIRL
ncbi:hypothetical protein ACPV3A_23625 [Paenibacillus sp. Dod16]|uniref:hypothetical protein n=1 Tax=Paenibacillus sp. Dod16 TaxID=3416392 RepID=UPI003CF32A82